MDAKEALRRANEVRERQKAEAERVEESRRIRLAELRQKWIEESVPWFEKNWLPTIIEAANAGCTSCVLRFPDIDYGNGWAPDYQVLHKILRERGYRVNFDGYVDRTIDGSGYSLGGYSSHYVRWDDPNER